VDIFFFKHKLRADRTFDKAAATRGNEKLGYIFHSATVCVENSSVFPPEGSDYQMLIKEFVLPSDRCD
jgi:hypothetical protein